MRAVLLIVLGFLVGYQVGKVAQRRSETSSEGSTDSMAGRGKRLASLAAAASLAAVNRARASTTSH
jgi:hypothetical protein